MTDELLDRNIYLPLIEMNIVQYGESKWWLNIKLIRRGYSTIWNIKTSPGVGFDVSNILTLVLI
jgi:hypothetical protein